MFSTVALILLVFVGALLVFISRQPERFLVERSARVEAPLDVVFAQVNDLHNWEHWSPWAKRDPQMQNVYEGPSAGVGAVHRWAGDKQVGEGSMTIVHSQPHQQVDIELAFLKPFRATHQVVFRFEPEGDGTRVTWSMSGRNNFMAKAMHLAMNMDKMCGGDFEQGLAQLKGLAEAAHQGA